MTSSAFRLANCAILLLFVGISSSRTAVLGHQEASEKRPIPPGTVYACPMHPDATAAEPGTCPRCGMTLAPMDPFDAREYLVDATTAPRVVRPGESFRLHLTVREPVSRAVVREFATVHDKRFHLFVISQDLEHYAHVHPEQDPDGSWSIEVTLPRAGYYKLYADFLPMGGTPQVVAAPLVTPGFGGDLASSSAVLVPDREFTKPVGDMRVRLALPETPLVAGREERFAFELTDRESGTPVSDIEPYLAAWGHTLLISQDTQAVVHAHPVELVPEGDPAARGGPVITFKALFPKPGHYRLWTQMKRNGEVVTAMYTVNVESPAKS
jgi:hypothetical protein